MDENNNLSKKIKHARVLAGLSQKDLAKKLNFSDKTISAYETGRATPPISILLKISKITNTDITEIVSTRKKKKKSKTRIKIDSFVGVVLLDKNERLYLIREEDKFRISQGRWNLPGGSVDGNESLIVAAVRETREETGYRAEVEALVGCYKCKKGRNSWVYIVFRARLLGNGQDVVDPGVKSGKWFTKEEFLNLNSTKIVHPDMKLVYNIATKKQGLSLESIKFIDYDKNT